jgi:hypothetical protein
LQTRLALPFPLRPPPPPAPPLLRVVATTANCYVLASIRRERRGGRARRDKRTGASAAAAPEKSTATTAAVLLKRLPSADLASLAAAAAPHPPPAAAFGGRWDYEAQLRELQRQRGWYLMSTAAADPYSLAQLMAHEEEGGSRRRCGRCRPRGGGARLAPSARRRPRPCASRPSTGAFTAGLRSHVGPIERPAKKSPPPPPPPLLLPAGTLGGMPVY